MRALIVKEIRCSDIFYASLALVYTKLEFL